MSLETITITDPQSGSQAKILPGFGFNCFSYRAAHDGGETELIWSEPGFERGDKRASGSGIPLLFPYPGRIRGKTLQWERREYSLEGDDGRGNAIHGFVLARPWRVLQQTDAEVTAAFQAAVDDPKLLDCWPADFRITVTYRFEHGGLSSAFTIENPGDQPLPFGFGTHPYFCVPLGGASADACRVVLPASSRWELAEMLPTGRQHPLDQIEKYHAGLAFGEMAFDDVFCDLQFQDDRCTFQVIDAESRRQLDVEFDRSFRECVVYNPPHRQAVCIEPYTCVPNAVELKEQGIDSGLRVLAPGQSVPMQITIKLR
jgi:aldose 1-epimerase